jgi:transposase
MITLQSAAEYVATSKASKAFLLIIGKIKQTFSFEQERKNRLKRFIEVVEDYKAGMLINDIEKKHGCSRHTIYRYVTMSQLAKRGQHKTSTTTEEEIIKRLKAGQTYKQITSELKTAAITVNKIAMKHGLMRRGKK